MKILLIEDELSVSSFIKRGLEEQGNTVLQAFDGTTGLKLAFQEEFDVIILDVVMPGMNGLEVCIWWRPGDAHEGPAAERRNKCGEKQSTGAVPGNIFVTAGKAA